MLKYRSLFAAFTVIVLVHSTLFAQASPVTGRVVDPQGASVANAEISLVPGGAGQRTRSTPASCPFS